MEGRGALVGRVEDQMPSIIRYSVRKGDGYARGLEEFVPGRGEECSILLATFVSDEAP